MLKARKERALLQESPEEQAKRRNEASLPEEVRKRVQIRRAVYTSVAKVQEVASAASELRVVSAQKEMEIKMSTDVEKCAKLRVKELKKEVARDVTEPMLVQFTVRDAAKAKVEAGDLYRLLDTDIADCVERFNTARRLGSEKAAWAGIGVLTQAAECDIAGRAFSMNNQLNWEVINDNPAVERRLKQQQQSTYPLLTQLLTVVLISFINYITYKQS